MGDYAYFPLPASWLSVKVKLFFSPKVRYYVKERREVLCAIHNNDFGEWFYRVRIGG